MKKYVREYRGCRVPVKATHFAEVTGYNHPAFYSDNHIWVIFEDSLHCHQNSCIPRNAIELPEAPQEWSGEGLPPVGTLCTISADGFEYLFSAASNELSSITESTELVVVGHCTRHDNGAKCVTLMARDSKAARGFTTVNPDFINPLKTQQEKDREAFISAARKATNADVNDVVATDIFDDMYHAGFTAPKADDYDQE